MSFRMYLWQKEGCFIVIKFLQKQVKNVENSDFFRILMLLWYNKSSNLTAII